MSEIHLPPGFFYGAATAALQVEGAVDADGRGTSWWEDFCRDHPGRIHEAATPERACDHFHMWKEDLDLIAEMGHNAYRFSVAWPRVVPTGSGRVEPRGLDFYDRLVDGLRARAIEPIVTLYHWDLPRELAAIGAWENRAVVDRFGEFADAVGRRLGDRVRWWMTLNEPGWSTLNGWVTGLHPPAKRDPAAAFLVAAHLMVAHAIAKRALAAHSPGSRIGLAANLSPCRPATDSDPDRAAAAQADGFLNRWLLEPAVLGRFPADVRAELARCGMDPQLSDADRALVAAHPVDVLGVNYYYPHRVSAEAPADAFHINNAGAGGADSQLAIAGRFRMVKSAAARATEWGWEIDPSGLEELLLRVQRLRPGLPQMVTENGIALVDPGPGRGGFDDLPRIAFLAQHLAAVARALAAGADVRGYLMWALMDNFSWLNGYRKRYGFLHVDRATMKRTRRPSSFFFELIARTGKFDEP